MWWYLRSFLLSLQFGFRLQCQFSVFGHFELIELWEVFLQLICKAFQIDSMVWRICPCTCFRRQVSIWSRSLFIRSSRGDPGRFFSSLSFRTVSSSRASSIRRCLRCCPPCRVHMEETLFMHSIVLTEYCFVDWMDVYCFVSLFHGTIIFFNIAWISCKIVKCYLLCVLF